MLGLGARRRIHPRYLQTKLHVVAIGQQRHFSLSEGRTEIINAVQYTIPDSIMAFSEMVVPASLPTYTTGIIIITILTRLAFVTPFAIWARRRKWRLQEEVKPRVIAEYRHGWGPQYTERLRRDGKTKEELQKIIHSNLNLRTNELMKKYHCTPFPSILVPLSFTSPLFILNSIIYDYMADLPAIAFNTAPLEYFLTLPSQNSAPIMPIMITVFSMLSVQMGTWSPKGIKQLSDSPTRKELEPKGRETSGTRPSKFLQSTFRLLAVARGVIAIGLPGTVHVYWFTSTILSMIESFIFSLVERQRSVLWGIHSPLLRSARSDLVRQGVVLSPDSPSERATPQPKPLWARYLQSTPQDVKEIKSEIRNSPRNSWLWIRRLIRMGKGDNASHETMTASEALPMEETTSREVQKAKKSGAQPSKHSNAKRLGGHKKLAANS